MSSAKRYLLTALAFAFCMLMITAFAPRAVHAITATLVQVVNTSANPVPIPDVANRFQADICDVTGAGTTANQLPYCTAGMSRTFVVPTTTASGQTVKRLIVDNVSGNCSTFNNNGGINIQSVQIASTFLPDSVPNGAGATHYIPVNANKFAYTNANVANNGILAGVQETDYGFGQTTRFAFNPGDTVSVGTWWGWIGTGPLDYFCFARVEGYLVTQ